MDKKNLYSKYSGVPELLPKDFDLKKKQLVHPSFKGKPGLVIFYAPWCGHCQTMVDTVSDLAIQFRYIFPIGVVNCENVANHPICRTFQINVFPTIFQQTPQNKLKPYQGNRDKDSLLNFIYTNTLGSN